MNLNQKIALITDGKRGLGKNAALRLAGCGADSIITYHSHKDEADSVVSEIESKDQRAVTTSFTGGNEHLGISFRSKTKKINEWQGKYR